MHIGEEIISQQGSFSRVRRWYSGWISGGLLIFGQTGKETVKIEDVIKPLNTFTVTPKWEVYRETPPPTSEYELRPTIKLI